MPALLRPGAARPRRAGAVAVPPLTWNDVERIRSVPGRSALLFLTDRCPVGCEHCSVDSRRDGPRITDFALFAEMVNGLASLNTLDLVGISGGEPFTERRALTYAAGVLATAGKRLVIYTSGAWARSSVPSWAADVLSRATCVCLSTDAYHAAYIADETFIRAARAVRETGGWLVVQVAGPERQAARASALLREAFGPEWRDGAEVSRVPLLPYGRAAGLSRAAAPQRGDTFGRCRLSAAPVVRYDGQASACCNEAVIMGAGPDWLRRRLRTRAELVDALGGFIADPYLRAIGTAGFAPLTWLPGNQDLAAGEFRDICHLCWEISRRPRSPRQDALLALLGQPVRP